MVTLRNTVLPLLLVLCTSGTAIYAHPTDGATLHNRAYKDLTKEQMDKVDQIEMPKCYDTCAIGNSDYIPLCAHTDQDTPESEQEEAIANSYSCICTDKLYLETQFSCLVKQCGSNSTALDTSMSSLYAMCKVYADIVFPKPEVLLNDLCLLDDMPKGATVPTDLALMTELWPDYKFATKFPSQTATTWVPSGTPIESFIPSGYVQPTWTCTPTPLAGSEEEEDTTTGTLKPTSSTGNSTSTTDKGAANSGKQGMVSMGMVVLSVAAVALFL